MRNLPLRLSALLLIIASAGAQPPLSARNHGQLTAQKQGQRFSNPLDYWLHKFNRDDIDYGEKVEEVRADLLAGTIQNPFFWAIAWGGVLLIGLFAMVIHQERERKHRHLIAARFLTWYHNQLRDARARASEELERFERLRKTIDLRDMAAAAAGTQAPKAPAAGGTDLMAENNSLRQKISLLETTEKIFRQENTELKRLLRQAQHDPNNRQASQQKDNSNGK